MAAQQDNRRCRGLERTYQIDWPNVLFVTADQWRADCLSLAGYPVVQTPHLDALAAECVTFRSHFASAAPCAPAGACIYTGRLDYDLAGLPPLCFDISREPADMRDLANDDKTERLAMAEAMPS